MTRIKSWRALGLAACLAGCRPAPVSALPPHPVETSPARALNRPQSLLLPATATLNAPAASGAAADYRVEVRLPKGVVPRLGPEGAFVQLPIVRHNRVQASLVKEAPGALSLLLAGQVQELNGRGVQVELELEPAGLFTVDFSSLSSPRGLGTQVFAVRGAKAAEVDVELLDVLKDGQALVAGPLKDGEPVVVRGLDGLLDGDKVAAAAPREGQ